MLGLVTPPDHWGQDVQRRRHHPPGWGPGACWSGEPPTGKAAAGLSPGGADRPADAGRVAWLLQRQTAANLRRLNHLREAPATSGPTQEGTATEPLNEAAADDSPGDEPSGFGTAPMCHRTEQPSLQRLARSGDTRTVLCSSLIIEGVRDACSASRRGDEAIGRPWRPRSDRQALPPAMGPGSGRPDGPYRRELSGPGSDQAPMAESRWGNARGPCCTSRRRPGGRA